MANGTTTNGNGRNGNGSLTWKNLIDVAVRIAGVIMIPLLIYTAKTVMDINTRVTAIEANRFTSADAARVQTQITDLWRAVGVAREEVPPEWLRTEISRIHTRLDRVEDELKAHAANDR